MSEKNVVYQKQDTHPSAYLSGGEHPIITLFFEVAQLKNLYRQGWRKPGRDVSAIDGESVADHCFGVALLSYVIAEQYRPDLNALHAMRLGLFHELGEIHAGDITPYDGVDPEEKHRREREGVERVVACLAHPERYVALWEEYEAKKTGEAQLVARVDKLEMALQARLYEHMGYSLPEFFPDVARRVQDDPLLSKILEELISTRESK